MFESIQTAILIMQKKLKSNQTKNTTQKIKRGHLAEQKSNSHKNSDKNFKIKKIKRADTNVEIRNHISRIE